MNKGQTSATAEPSELTHLLGDAGPAAIGAMRAELMDARSRLAHSALATEAMKIRIQSLVASLRRGVEALREYTDTCEALDAMELELSCFDDVKPNS